MHRLIWSISVENLDFEERASTGVDRGRCRVLGLLSVVEICRDLARFSQSRQDFFSNFFLSKKFYEFGRNLLFGFRLKMKL